MLIRKVNCKVCNCSVYIVNILSKPFHLYIMYLVLAQGHYTLLILVFFCKIDRLLINYLRKIGQLWPGLLFWNSQNIRPIGQLWPIGQLLTKHLPNEQDLAKGKIMPSPTQNLCCSKVSCKIGKTRPLPKAKQKYKLYIQWIPVIRKILIICNNKKIWDFPVNRYADFFR